MKKTMLVISALAAVLNADFLSVSAGVGIQRQIIDGYVKKGNTVNYFNNSSAQTDGNVNSGDFALKDKSNPYFWVKLIHPMPFLPNVKFQYTKYDSSGRSSYIAGGVKIFSDVYIPTALTNALTEQSIDSYDVTFFYEFNPVIADIEAGFGVDIWNGKTKIYGNGAGVSKTWVDSGWSVVLPYLYLHLQSMRFFNVSLSADAKYAKIGDYHHYDYQGALQYTIDITGPVNPFVKLGYRYKDVYGEDGSYQTSIKYKGAYLEIGAEF